jgi:hypothetical protein
MKLRRLVIAITFLLTTLTTACFGLLGGGSPELSAVLTVVNDVDPPVTMTIQIRQDGDDDELATLPGGSERALTYTSRNMRGIYQLVAREATGGAVLSREFTLFSGAQVRWQIRTNSLSVTQPR